MIRTTQVKAFDESMRIRFKKSALADKWCVGEGLEIGASAHNSFQLPGSRNVANLVGFDVYKEEQVKLCGEYAEIDIVADGSDIPLPDQSQDYIISSHMIEHHVNPVLCFLEWQRLLKPGGIMFMIFPKRDALPTDRERDITPVDDILQAFDNGVEADNIDHGHVFVYTLESMKELIDCASAYGLRWELVDERETDDKVGNGHLLVYRQLPIIEAVVEEPAEAPQPRRRRTKTT